VVQLRPGGQIRTAGGQAATADGGTISATTDGWMWDLTIPGNNDHDFYVLPSTAADDYEYDALTVGQLSLRTTAAVAFGRGKTLGSIPWMQIEFSTRPSSRIKGSSWLGVVRAVLPGLTRIGIIFSLAPQRARQSVRNSLPAGDTHGNESSNGVYTGANLFQNYNPTAPGYEELDPSLPYVIFDPEG
jgi:hypothetical protein